MNVIRNERGFTMAELLVSTLVSMAVLGGAVTLTSQVQKAYRVQMEDAAAEQEGRYALDWITRLIRRAGNNPFGIATSECPADDPAPPVEFSTIVFDPDADGGNDDIRLQTDSNPPDGILGGSGGVCDQKEEDVTVSFDSDTNTILFRDNNMPEAASVRTDAVIDNLEFIYKNSKHSTTEDDGTAVTPAGTYFVEVQVRVRTRTVDANTGSPMTRLLTQEVRVRGRGY